jgi:hypothetical protein
MDPKIYDIPFFQGMQNNPLDFSKNAVSELQLIAGGELHPITPQSFDWERNTGAQESYAQLMSISKSVFGGDGSIGFSLMTGVFWCTVWETLVATGLQGSCFLPIPLSFWLPSRSYNMIRETGVVSLRISFRQALTVATNVSSIILANTSLRINALGMIESNPFPV